MDSYGGFVRYDGSRLLLGIRENGINETDPAHDADMAAKYPDRSLIWIDARSGIPTGVAINFGVTPTLPAGAAVVGGSGGYYFNFDAADDGVVYIGYRNVILRYAPEGDGFAAPTVAYTHEDDGSDQYNNWRWETIRARGAGADTKLSAGGKTWRNRQQAYSFRTDDGITYELDGYAPFQGGSSHVVPSGFEGEDTVEWIFGSIYPGSDGGLGTGIVKGVRDLEFDVDFIREAFPAEADFEGEYTPQFVSDADVHPDFPGVVSYSTPSWNSLAVVGGDYRPGWIAVHDYDGLLLFAHKLDVTEEAEFISDPGYQSAQWHGTLGTVSVNVVPGMEPGTAEILWYGGIYGYGRYLFGTTVDPSASGEPIIEVLGTGNESLIGGDLTSPNDDGNEADLNDPSWGWKSITSNNEPGFDGGELAFNIFDNKTGGGIDKWCCDDPTPEAPLNVTVEFETPVSLTHFTITSGNDSPERDPIRFQIQGSIDGTTFTPLYVRDSDESLWTERSQVVKITLPQPSALYQFIRYEVTDTSGPNHQLSEIEYFGSFGGTNLARFTRLDRSLTSVTIQLTDGEDTTLEEGSIFLTIDDVAVTPVITKVDGVTTVSYMPAVPFAPSSVHTYSLNAEDSAGNDIASTGSFTMPTPLMPLDGLNGPDGDAGVWGLRQIWNGGNLGSLAAALAVIADPVAAGATVSDTAVATIDFVETTTPGNAGIITGDMPFPAEAEGMTPDDFLIVGKASFTVAESGEYTIGCHSDDGFGLILMGAEFTSASGNGRIDSSFPSILAHPGVTGDSNTRGVVTLQAGTVYGIHLVGYERGGGASFEFYAAKGAFALDADSEAWFAIGDAAGPLQLVGSGAPFSITDIVRNGSTLTITWRSKPGESFALDRSTTLPDWGEVADGLPSDGETTSYTFERVTAEEEYFRTRRE
ncbi:MAG: discoidin domain-containing protein, partial [Verrucomicrobia bacterium]|nr:discoidin domain-containing protein [Verrucomicrobiota bacterium]